MEERNVGMNNQKVGNDDAFSKPKFHLAERADEYLEKGKKKFEDIKSELPDSIENATSQTVNWVKLNPYKATSLALLGILSFRSKLARNIGLILAATAGTTFIKNKFEVPKKN